MQAASAWGTYVMAHAYTSAAVQRLVHNGVKVIEHGLLIDDETARLCAENDVVISTQIAIFRMGAELPGMSDENRRKMQQVLAGQDRLIELIEKYGIKTGFGTDFVFGTYPRIAEEFTARARDTSRRRRSCARPRRSPPRSFDWRGPSCATRSSARSARAGSPICC